MSTATLKKLAMTAAGTALLSFGVGEVAKAATMVSGTIFDDNAGNVTVDYWNFSVNTASLVEIDVLSRRVLEGDGRRGKSSLDSFLRLYEFDANGSLGQLGDLVARNNNVARTMDFGLADGSVSRLDSFLSVNLDVGDYVLAISDSHLSEREARKGSNKARFAGTFGDYQITFNGDVDVQSVPEPASMLGLLTIGAMGVGSALKRNKRKDA